MREIMCIACGEMFDPNCGEATRWARSSLYCVDICYTCQHERIMNFEIRLSDIRRRLRCYIGTPVLERIDQVMKVYMDHLDEKNVRRITDPAILHMEEYNTIKRKYPRPLPIKQAIPGGQFVIDGRKNED